MSHTKQQEAKQVGYFLVSFPNQEANTLFAEEFGFGVGRSAGDFFQRDFIASLGAANAEDPVTMISAQDANNSQELRRLKTIAAKQGGKVSPASIITIGDTDAGPTPIPVDLKKIRAALADQKLVGEAKCYMLSQPGQTVVRLFFTDMADKTKIVETLSSALGIKDGAFDSYATTELFPGVSRAK